jgi:hypothetical protein
VTTARFSRSITLVMGAALSLAALPALAQFGSIFRDETPRPPVDIPDGRMNPNPMPQPLPPPDYPQQPRQALPRPAPMPLPTNLPPSGPARGNPIESQPLPPPPGVTTAPPQAAQPPAQAALPPAAPAQTAPGQSAPNQATPDQQNATPAPAEGTLPPSEVVVEPPPQRISNPTAVFAGLDKITGRITSFDVAINETVQFGALRVTPRVCYSRPPTETRRTDAFLDVDEVTLQGEVRRIFTGWMFASSPGLHAVEHPIYDIWLTDCKGGTLNVAGSDGNGPPKEAARPAPKQPASAAQRRR